MNVYDSGRMADAMVKSGYAETKDCAEADLIVLNTCHIREKATEKIYSEVGRLKALRKKNPDLKIAVAGCVAQAEGTEIQRRQPAVDIVVGPQAYHRLPDLVAKAGSGTSVADTDFPLRSKFSRLPRNRLPRGQVTAFLTIQEGCDKFCTFCVVPYTRGAEDSRPAAEVVEEANLLVERGARDITLLGQNVNSYNGVGPDGGKRSLADLIVELSKIEALKRIRFTTSHPRDMSQDLIDAFVECDKLMPYLHLPVQSGSDRILRAMNRRHTARQYVDLIRRIRGRRPDIVISGDFIVAFPGETEEDFLQTIELVEEVSYGRSYSFKYSPRPGTPAAALPQIDGDVASERLARLQRLLRKQQQECQRNFVGRTVSVLFERKGRKPGQLVGKSEHLHAVHAQATADCLGQIRKVEIVRSEANSLSGKLVSVREPVGGSPRRR